MCARLASAKRLSTVDGALLAHYCYLWADCVRLQADADQLTSTWYQTASGEPRMHPLFAQLRQYRLALRTILVEFGLTPAARSRVSSMAPEDVATTDPRKAKFLDALA